MRFDIADTVSKKRESNLRPDAYTVKTVDQKPQITEIDIYLE